MHGVELQIQQNTKRHYKCCLAGALIDFALLLFFIKLTKVSNFSIKFFID
jgi:hypothetical protein